MRYCSPVDVLLSALPAASPTPLGSVRSRPKVPGRPVLALTVRVAPVPVMPVIDAEPAPLPDNEKFDVPTPVTVSLNVTVQLTVAALVGLGSARVIETTVGAVLSIVYACPVNVALNWLAAASMMPDVSDRLRRRPPSPDPVLAVTVRVVPEPLTPVIDAPLGPVAAR